MTIQLLAGFFIFALLGLAAVLARPGRPCPPAPPAAPRQYADYRWDLPSRSLTVVHVVDSRQAERSKYFIYWN